MLAYILVFDGGSLGNPGRTYGSYRIQPRQGKPQPTERKTFRRGTNNEAEYWTLIAGLKAVLDQLEKKEVDPKNVQIEVRGDSQLVINQVRGAWKAKNPRMRLLRDEAKELLDRFGSVNLVLQGRSQTVQILGH